MRLRLATVNLLHGRSLTDGRVDIRRAADAVAALDADVIALQEVDRGQPRSGGDDQAAVIAAASGAVSCFAPTVLGEPGTRWTAAGEADEASFWAPPGTGGPDADGGADRDGERPAPAGAQYGVALLVRPPVRRWHLLRLRPASVRSPVVIPGTRRILWLRDEPRAVVAAVLDGPVPLTVAGTHLSFVPVWNATQLRRTAAAVRELPGPRVLLGDLNLPGAVPARITGMRSLVTGRTFPAPAPRLQADHVLADDDGTRLSVRRAEVVELPFSDHRALVVDIEVA